MVSCVAVEVRVGGSKPFDLFGHREQVLTQAPHALVITFFYQHFSDVG